MNWGLLFSLSACVGFWALLTVLVVLWVTS